LFDEAWHPNCSSTNGSALQHRALSHHEKFKVVPVSEAFLRDDV
jgi:hypothetical protein